MPLARTIKDADRMARSAAANKLKSEYGIRLCTRDWTNENLAERIQQIEPGLSGEPILVIRAWISMKAANVAQPREIARPAREYSPAKDRSLAAAMARLADTPKPIAMASNIPLTAMDWR